MIFSRHLATEPGSSPDRRPRVSGEDLKMSREIYRYVFPAEVEMSEVEASLLLAFLATESLHGESQVRMDASHHLDPQRRTCAIDAHTPVGRDLNCLFVGFLRHEFGDESFSVQHSETHSKHPPEELCV